MSNVETAIASGAAPPPAKEKKPRATKAVKVPKEKKPKASKASAPAHPPYFQMIKEALLALKEKTGSSPYAIAKYMDEKHKGVLPSNYKKMLAVQLKKFAANGKLVKVKASFKLSEASKKVAKPEKEKKAAAAKKVVEKKKPQQPKAAKAAHAVSKKRKAAVSSPKPAKAGKKVAVAGVKKVKKAAPAKPKQPKSIKKSPAPKRAKKAAA